MAGASTGAQPTNRRQGVAASTWAGIATLAASGLLLYTGAMTGEWRGVAVTEVQILAVGLTTWFVLRED